jgi:hypothetical protein
MRWLTLVVVLIGLSACVKIPDVYLIDRHTVMESEASGEWPKLEQRFRQQGVSDGPVDLAKDPSGRRRERAFRILNGEFPMQSASKETQAK